MKTSSSKKTPKDYGWRAGNFYEVSRKKFENKTYLLKVYKGGPKDTYSHYVKYYDHSHGTIHKIDFEWLLEPNMMLSRKLNKQQLVLWLLSHGTTLPEAFKDEKDTQNKG